MMPFKDTGVEGYSKKKILYLATEYNNSFTSSLHMCDQYQAFKCLLPRTNRMCNILR